LGYTCIVFADGKSFTRFGAVRDGGTPSIAPAIQRESAVGSEIIDIRRFEVSAFSELLDAEAHAWNEGLYWDFTSSARVISNCLKERRLSGYALVLDGIVRGYCFFFCDGEKGLMGDLFAGPLHAGLDDVLRLLEHANETLLAIPGLRRVEAQLPHYSFENLEGNFRSWNYSGYRRRFMALSFPEWRPGALPNPGSSNSARRAVAHPDDFWIMPCDKKYVREAAELVFSAYHNHIDAAINDQYSSLAGATRLLDNIVHYQGCGDFMEQVSKVAIHRQTRKLGGVLTVTTVRPDTAHIPQIAVARTLQGGGLGTALLESAFNDLARAGYQRVSLTVTDANARALSLYERLGFKTFRTFGAFVFNR
jgi:ribosomal protein S18 acetylase RimI-like enzyme